MGFVWEIANNINWGFQGKTKDLQSKLDRIKYNDLVIIKSITSISQDDSSYSSNSLNKNTTTIENAINENSELGYWKQKN